jgi:hypothetical protein
MHSSLPLKKWSIFFFLPVPFLFYWYTCLPSIGMGDSVLFLHAVRALKISTWVNNHNLTALWGWPFQFLPFGDLAYRGNLSCAFSSAIAICIFYIALYQIHRCLMTAIVGAIFMMISQSVWWHATDLADYSMNTVFVATAIYFYGKLHRSDSIKYLYILFFVSGFALFQHYLLGSLLIGCIAAFIRRVIKRKENFWSTSGKAALFFFIGALPWFMTFLHDVSTNGSVAQTFSGCFGGPFKGLFFKEPVWNGLREFFTLVFIQFPSLYLVAIIFGLFLFLRSWKLSDSAIGIIFSVIPIIYFEVGLNTWALFAQYISVFIFMAFWGSFAIYWAIHHPKVQKHSLGKAILAILIICSMIWTVYFYANLSVWGMNPNSMWYSRYNNSYTFNTYRLNEFLANPNKRYNDDISSVCKLMLGKLPPHAQVWDSDSRLFFQMKEYYQQYYHQRLDIDMQLINSFGFANWGSDKNGFINAIKRAYRNGEDLYICSLGHPFASLMTQIPNKEQYQFEKFYLDANRWIYRLVTSREKKQENNTLLHRWDVLPTNKPSKINLNDENVLDFHQGHFVYQEDMSNYGPHWLNEDQIFFSPSRIGSEIGFLLRFNEAFKGTLAVNLTISFDSGEIEILLNDHPLNETPIDLYTKGISVKKFELPNVSFEKGNNILSIKVIGKNQNSSDIKLGVDTIEIIPTP